MSRKYHATSAFALIAVAAILIAIFFNLRARLASARTEIAALEHKNAIARSELSKLGHLLPQPIENAAGDAQLTSPEAENSVNIALRREAILRSWIALAYERFFRTANLTNEQKLAFEEAVVAHWLRWADVVDVAREQGFQQNDPAWANLWRPEADQYEADVQQALGPAGVQVLQQYQSMAGPQEVADAVAGLVYENGEPLSGAQAAALKQILAENSSSYRKGGAADYTTLSRSTALVEAKQVLSPAQMEALQTAMNSIPAYYQLNRLLTAATARQAAAPAPEGH